MELIFELGRHREQLDKERNKIILDNGVSYEDNRILEVLLRLQVKKGFCDEVTLSCNLSKMQS